ncbi:MAG: MFS transporter [Chloroflexi bacterium]|nr:MFS transporter [Chloroflexota bacterium]
MEQVKVPSNYKWIALGITTLGALMFAIDATVVVLAVPAIMAELHSNLIIMVWVIMAYIFMSTVLLLALGRVADIYGRVRLYNLGFVVFTLGSAFCGLVQTDLQLVAARIVQGIGGAMLLVNSLAIITEVFPPRQRGTAMGINSLVFGAGGVIGPVVGGLILAITTWRWIFLINIPIGIIGTTLSYRYLRELSVRHGRETLDVVGTATFSFGLLCLLLAFTQGIELGFEAPIILALFGLFVVSMAFFLFWERRSESPALDLGLFRNRLYDFSVVAASLQSLAIFAVQFLVVFYLQAVRGYSPIDAAIHLLPMPLTISLIGPFGGRLSDRVGAAIPATTGLLIQSVGLYVLSTLTADSPYSHLAIGLVLMGTGGGLFFSPNTSAAMGTAPTPRLGVAAATLATLRNTGMVTSYALALAVAAGALPRNLMLSLFTGTATHLGTGLMTAFVDGMEAAFRVSIVICLIAAAMSLVRGPERRRA